MNLSTDIRADLNQLVTSEEHILLASWLAPSCNCPPALSATFGADYHKDSRLRLQQYDCVAADYA